MNARGSPWHPARSHRARDAGFTFLEFIAVLVMVAIVTATALVNLNTKAVRGAMEQAIKLRRDLRHIQVLALTWGVPLRLTTASDGTSYTVTCRAAVAGTPCATVDTTPLDPATGESFSTTLTDNVLIFPQGDIVDFDGLGRPVDSSALVAVDPARTYTLKINGTTEATVTLHPITGFAEVSF